MRTKVNGKTKTKTVTERVRVTTHKETYYFPYYSERDVSGLFYLDCDRAYLQRKCIWITKCKKIFSGEEIDSEIKDFISMNRDLYQD